jgi:hypothetical protein
MSGKPSFKVAGAGAKWKRFPLRELAAAPIRRDWRQGLVTLVNPGSHHRPVLRVSSFLYLTFAGLSGHGFAGTVGTKNVTGVNFPSFQLGHDTRILASPLPTSSGTRTEPMK